VKKLVMYGLVIAAIGVLLYLVDMFMPLGISMEMSGMPVFPLLTLVALGALVALYGYMKK